MPRSRGTGTILGAQDTPGLTRSVDQPPSLLLDPHRVQALRTATDTLAVEGAQNGSAEEETAATRGLGNRQNEASSAGLSVMSAVREAVPGVSLEQSPSLYPKQEWVGRVTAIHEEEFDARLRDLANGNREVATIDLEEIGPQDRKRVRVGSLFHWVLGYERSVSGTRSNVSRIVFLDPPRPTQRDLEAGLEWADRLRTKWNLD